MNIIKILSFDKFWRLSPEILLNIYKSLIRSILDYSSFIIDSISQSFIKKLEAIQNNVLRIIFQTKWDELSTNELRENANIIRIEDRLKTLNKRYLKKALLNNNPLIKELIDGFLMFRTNFNNQPNKQSTFLSCILNTNNRNASSD